MKRFFILASALVFSASTTAYAQDDVAPAGPPAIDENADGLDDGRQKRHRHGGRGFRGVRGLGIELTDEQREGLKSAVEALREDGAEKEDIRAAVDEQLSGFGFDIEALRAEQEAEREARQAEREAVRAIVDQLKEEGASREEIKAALEEQGFEAPRRGKRGKRGGRGGFGGARGGEEAPAAPEGAE